MKITSSALANIVLATILITSMFFSAVTLSASQYDPWLDYNDDGYINAKDAILLGMAFNSQGDPTKNVNVVNWPTTQTVEVWYAAAVPPSHTSDWFNASGYGHLHILVYTIGLTTVSETLRLYVYGRLWNEAHTMYYMPVAHIIDFDIYTQHTSITIPVPSEEFRFSVFAVGESDGLFSLSFYLTWS